MATATKAIPVELASDPDMWADIRALMVPVLIRELGRAFELGWIIAVLELDAITKDFAEDVQARALAMMDQFLTERLMSPPEFTTRQKLDDYIDSGYVSNFWNKWETSQIEALGLALHKGNTQSLGANQVAKMIEPQFGKARAQLIAATEMTNIMGIANQAAYRQVGFGQWEWRTAADSRVDPVCQALDGEIFDIGTQFSAAHPRCRCWPVPVPDSLPEAAIDGAPPQLPEVGGAETWWEGYDEAAQLRDMTDGATVQKRMYNDMVERVAEPGPAGLQTWTALDEYMQSGYAAQNQTLRGKGMLSLDAQQVAEAKIRNRLMRGAGGYTLDRPVVVYRGIHPDALTQTFGVEPSPKPFAGGAPGATSRRVPNGLRFQDEGFTSASSQYEQAKKFAGNDGIVVAMKLPVGTQVLPGTDFEREFILAPGSVFEVKASVNPLEAGEATGLFSGDFTVVDVIPGKYDGPQEEPGQKLADLSDTPDFSQVPEVSALKEWWKAKRRPDRTTAFVWGPDEVVIL